MVATVVLIALAYIALMKLVKQAVESRGDVSVYLNAARHLTAGKNPFAEGWYLYPVLWAWILIPLSKLGPAGFALVWGSTLIASWVASYFLIGALFPTLRSHRHATLLLALPHVVLFRWLWNGLGAGQVTLPLLVGLLAVIYLVDRKRHFLASVVLGFAGVVKVFPLYLGLLFCRPLRVIPIVLLGVCVAGFFFLPALDIGTARLLDLTHFQFYGNAQPSLSARLLWWPNYSPLPSLMRELGCRSTADISRAATIWLALSALIATLLYRETASRAERQLWIGFLLVSMVVTSPIAWGHYASFLLYPLAAMISFLASTPQGVRYRGLIVGAIAGTAVLLNIESALFVGTNDHKHLGLVAWALMLVWSALLVLLVRLRREPILKAIR